MRHNWDGRQYSVISLHVPSVVIGGSGEKVIQCLVGRTRDVLVIVYSFLARAYLTQSSEPPKITCATRPRSLQSSVYRLPLSII